MSTFLICHLGSCDGCHACQIHLVDAAVSLFFYSALVSFHHFLSTQSAPVSGFLILGHIALQRQLYLRKQITRLSHEAEVSSFQSRRRGSGTRPSLGGKENGGLLSGFSREAAVPLPAICRWPGGQHYSCGGVHFWQAAWLLAKARRYLSSKQ